LRIWILNDIHLELTRGWDLPAGDARPNFDVLVIAGDLIPRMERGVNWLLERVPDRPVIYVPGNHEPYGQDIDIDIVKARIAAEDSSVHILSDESITIDGITFVGATLWTDYNLFGDPDHAMAVAGESMNDFRKIRKSNYGLRLRPRDTLARHIRSRDFIARELRKPGRHVVVTHHGPHPECTRRGFEQDIVSAAYTSDLTTLIAEGAPELWIYGHTHETKKFAVGNSLLVTNQKGYGPWAKNETWENPDFNPNFVVEI
jgi:Icc-related predicted phosphoesterase